VEGLTVTYMPRNVGVGNVDTVQQRARFFGYKRSYLNYCRVFLDQTTIDTYNSIIEHEEDVRTRLEEFDVNNKHLDDWDREAVLDQMLNLTRANILYDNVDRDHFGNDWFRIHAPHDTENLIELNRASVLDFLGTKREDFSVDEGDPRRTEDQKHLVATLSLKDCLDHLLNRLKFTRESDSTSYSSLRGILKRYLNEHPDDNCLVYLMSANDLNDWKKRLRRLDRNDEIQQLFQGRNPRTGNTIYPGDFDIREENSLSIQIHRLRIVDSNGQDIRDENGLAKFTDVPTIAIWVPEHIGRDIVRQA